MSRAFIKRHRGRVDANHRECVEAAEERGWTVLDLAENGQGMPDLLAIRNSRFVFLECKTEAGKLRPKQQEMHARLRAAGCEVWVVRGRVQVLAVLEGATEALAAVDFGLG